MKDSSKKTICLVALLLLTLLCGCLGLTPIRAVYRVALTPVAEGGPYQIDPIDGGAVFVKEGLRLKVRHLGDGELNSQYPDVSNPFTYRGEVDPHLGYVPARFTVFQISLDNPTFDKVLVQPHAAILKTDRGTIMRPYQLTRAEAQGDPRNFETYWLSRGVQSGNMQKLYLERMGILRGALYHRDSFVFKGNAYRGLLVFDPLASGTGGATLRLAGFVLDFGLYDQPEEQVDLAFAFTVQAQVIEPEVASRDVGRMIPRVR